MIVNVVFPVNGSRLPVHHGYSLYGALSRLLPALHDGSIVFGLGLVTGQFVGQGMLHLDPSLSRLRLDQTDIPRVLKLAGKSLELDGDRVRLGVPHVEALTPAPELLSHFVTIKNANEADTFVISARKKLDEIGVGGTVTIPKIPNGPRKGEPRRQVLPVKKGVHQAVLIGYAMQVSGLTADESIKVQSATHWAKRHMGAGFFEGEEKESRLSTPRGVIDF
jgi:CRISPR-associated protein Cas6